MIGRRRVARMDVHWSPVMCNKWYLVFEESCTNFAKREERVELFFKLQLCSCFCSTVSPGGFLGSIPDN